MMVCSETINPFKEMLMMKETKTAQFNGQHFYIGVDVHKSNWRVTIRLSGLQLRTFSMNPSPTELHRYLRNNYPGGEYHTVYEAGYCGFWIHRELTRLGIKNVVVNPADVPSTHKEKDRKDDPIDSNKLSRELSNNSLGSIYVPDEKKEAIRSVSRLSRQYSQRSTQIKNRIKSFLNFVGQPIPEGYEKEHWTFRYITMLQELQFKEPENRIVLDEQLNELIHIRAKRLSILRKMRAISKEQPNISLLRTIPGVGFITAFTLFAELIDIHRFKKFDDLCSYVGLVPSIQRSDQTIHVNGISQRHNKYLRYLIVEAAWVATRKDPALTATFCELIKRMGKSKAIIRIAKKLLNRIRHVWLHQQEYVLAVVE
jgi:transposase